MENELLRCGRDTRFPLMSVINAYAQPGEEIRVIAVTPQTEAALIHFRQLAEELSQLQTEKGFVCAGPEMIPLTYAGDVNTQIELFHKLLPVFEDGDTLYGCLTCGNKPMPIAELMTIEYACRVLKDVSILRALQNPNAPQYRRYWDKVGDLDPYSACAGVAMVHTKYPFHRAYELSEELCSSAKRYAAELGEGQSEAERQRISTIDWHIEFGQGRGSVAEARKDYLTEDSEDGRDKAHPIRSLTLRPLAVIGGKKDSFRIYDFFRKLFDAIDSGLSKQSHDRISRGKLKGIRVPLKQGEWETRLYIRENGLNEFEKTAWDQVTSHAQIRSAPRRAVWSVRGRLKKQYEDQITVEVINVENPDVPPKKVANVSGCYLKREGDAYYLYRSDYCTLRRFHYALEERTQAKETIDFEVEEEIRRREDDLGKWLSPREKNEIRGTVRRKVLKPYINPVLDGALQGWAFDVAREGPVWYQFNGKRITALSSAERDLPAPTGRWRRGVLLAPGFMNDQNTLCLFPAFEATAERFRWREEDRLAYEMDYDMRENVLGGTDTQDPKEKQRRKELWMLPGQRIRTPKGQKPRYKGNPLPFFLLGRWEDLAVPAPPGSGASLIQKNPVALGKSPYHRIAYRHTPSEGVPEEHRSACTVCAVRLQQTPIYTSTIMIHIR